MRQPPKGRGRREGIKVGMVREEELEFMRSHRLMQEILVSTKATEQETGEKAKCWTLVNAQNGFNEISRLTMIWTA